MFLPDWPVLNAVIDWLAHGTWGITWWQMILFTLALTHVTMISVTVFLHRHQAHRALDLHPIASHFFRFWLWLTTGQVTKEWAAIHRKHHAKCEQADDPHSPHVYGIKKVLTQGAELYRAESKNKETMARFGHGTPDDWIERNLYTRFSWQGVGLMMIIDLTLFGAGGLAVWAMQMAWTPITAAGIINGAAHYWGYRNFEATDASTNLMPWGIIIAGEELHNNHHTHQRAIDAGCQVAGATVHHVTAELDHGPILAQAVVPVLAGDTAALLAARVLTQEHLIYPRAIAELLQNM
jgi:stearoyl-CoA desaturase (delta-9 desaturase)